MYQWDRSGRHALVVFVREYAVGHLLSVEQYNTYKFSVPFP